MSDDTSRTNNEKEQKTMTEEKAPTFEELCEKANETARLSRENERLAFQQRHPHYTPPPGSGPSLWAAWEMSNRELHGDAGFAERFPQHTSILMRVWSHDEDSFALATQLDALVYRKEQPTR